MQCTRILTAACLANMPIYFCSIGCPGNRSDECAVVSLGNKSEDTSKFIISSKSHRPIDTFYSQPSQSLDH